jgi:hypothetical protein
MKFLEWINHLLPNCQRALELAARGAERPLQWRERLAWRYNRRLCPFCSCQSVKLDYLEAKMQRREASPRS